MSAELITSHTPERPQGPHIIGVRNLQENPLSADELLYAQEQYTKIAEGRNVGPQRGGLLRQEVATALTDPRTVALEIALPSGHITWPLFVPVEHNSEYRPDFYDDHFGEGTVGHSYFYSALPEESAPIFEDEPLLSRQAVRDLAPFVLQNPIIALEYQKGPGEYVKKSFQKLVEEMSGQAEDVTPEDKNYGRPGIIFNETYIVVDHQNNPPKSVHQVFEEGLASGKFERHPENGATLLRPEDFRANNGALFNRIWDIYERQFDVLLEDHPSRQKQTREELEKMVLDETATSIGCYKNGEIIGLCYFVTDRKKCDWLNPDFYDERYGDEPTAIYPGIVIDINEAGEHHAAMMVDMLTELTKSAGINLWLLFQCTNISQTYVPFKVVYPRIERSEGLHAKPFKQVAEYASESWRVRPRLVPVN